MTAVTGFSRKLPPAGALEYQPGFLGGAEADDLFDRLHEELDWEHREIRMFGRRVAQPRLTAWYGDPGVGYSYSGTRWAADGWHELLESLRDRLESKTRVRFNSVLCNLYRNGDDAMGWHADNERELGPQPVIASISLGQVRRFSLRPRDRHRSPLHLEPGHGSLLIMSGDLQQHWLHSLPRSRRPMNPRINLTYRQVLSGDSW